MSNSFGYLIERLDGCLPWLCSSSCSFHCHTSVWWAHTHKGTFYTRGGTGSCVEVSSVVMIGPYMPKLRWLKYAAHHNSIRRKSRLRTRIRREHNIILIDLPDGSTLLLARMFIWAMFGVLGADSLNCFNNIDKMDRKIGFEMSWMVVEAIRGRCASFKLIYFSIIDSAIPSPFNHRSKGLILPRPTSPNGSIRCRVENGPRWIVRAQQH